METNETAEEASESVEETNETKKCSECGGEFDFDDVHLAPDDRILCDDCFFNEFDTCERCGNTFDKDDLYEVHIRHAHQPGEPYSMRYDSQYLCESCQDRLDVHQCRDCDERYEEDEMIRYDGDEWICDSCYQEDYFTCEGCEEVFHIDDEHGDGYCESCYHDRDNDDDDDIDEQDLEESTRLVHGISRRIEPVSFKRDAILDKLICDPRSEI